MSPTRTTAPRFRFLTGAPSPAWLTIATLHTAWFVSHNRLRKLRRLPRAVAAWALDSGGFTELSKHGRWTSTPEEYAAAVRRYRDEVGMLMWAAPQDWMCEPAMIRKTGLSVAEHQRRTVANFLHLRRIAPDLPIIPVIQGWSVASYLDCVRLYVAAGVDLAAEPVVGIGSVCRRTNPVSVSVIAAQLHGLGLRNLHGFGVSLQALPLAAEYLQSTDSMAWSAAERYAGDRCPEGRTDCRNCRHAAIEYGTDVEYRINGRTAA